MKSGQDFLDTWYALPVEVGGEAADVHVDIGVLVLAKGLVVLAVARHTERTYVVVVYQVTIVAIGHG